MTMIDRCFALALAALLGACAAGPDSTPPAPPSQPTAVRSAPQPAPADITAIAAAIAAPERSSSDRTEDAWRQPAVVLNFLGARPGMHVLDAFAAGGYYSELLARTVGPTGKVISYNNPPYARFAGNKPAQRFSADRLSNVEIVTGEVADLSLAANSLDGALFVLSYHDLYWRPEDGGWEKTDAATMLRVLHRALKPNGVVVVQDHAASPGADVQSSVDKLHRIDPERVKQDFLAAGFRLDDSSEAFAHPADDLTKLVFDPTLRHRTHQFMYRFVKQ